MDTRKSRFWLGSVAVLAGLLVSPAGVESQCAVTTAPIYTLPASPPTYPYAFIRITKTLSPAANCPNPTAGQMNAFGCGEIPNNTMATKLRASAYTNTVNPFCNWVCNCGPGYTMQVITIDTSDGLPVELMDFGIEEPEAEEIGDESGEKADDRETR